MNTSKKEASKNVKGKKKYRKPELKKYPSLKKVITGSVGITEI